MTELKIWPENMQLALSGAKRFDVRGDEHFAVDDVIHYREFRDKKHPEPGYYTGREMKVRIVHLQRGSHECRGTARTNPILRGYCVFQFEIVGKNFV